MLSFSFRQDLPRCINTTINTRTHTDIYIFTFGSGINHASLFIRASLPSTSFLSRRFAPFPRRILSTRHVHTATRPVLSRNSTYEYNDSTCFSYFPSETVVRSFSSVNFPFVTHGEGNPCFESTLTSFSFNVKYPMSLSLSLPPSCLSSCIVILLISKQPSFESTFTGSKIAVHVVIFVLSFSLPLFLRGNGLRGRIQIRLLYR